MSKSKIKVEQSVKPDLLLNLFKHKRVGIALIFVVLSLLFFKIGYLHLQPSAHDTAQWRATANEVIDYNNSHSDPALWNSNIFSGMPTYLISFPSKYPFVNNAIMKLNRIIDWKLAFLIIGATGMFFMLQYFGMNVLISAILGIAFSISSHYIAMIEMGHNTKMQAVMVLPWLLFSFIYLKDKKNLFSLGFFCIAFITELRTNHLQITYYMLLFMLFFWIHELLVAVKSRELKPFTTFSLLLLAGFAISAMAVSNPHLSNLEYSAFSMRGGAEGLTKAYAQSWSMHPGEFISFLFPNFFGGINQDYWGWMRFTQAYHYTGIIVLLLGIFALIFSKERYIKIFWIGCFAALIMSMGKYFPLLSDFLHDFFPGFNKFRVPATHLVIFQLLIVVLAGFGLKEILKRAGDEKFALIMRISMIVVLALFMINLAGGTTIFANLSFTSDAELAQLEQYKSSPQFSSYLKGIKDNRLDLLVDSVRNGLFLLSLAFGLIFFYSKKMLSKGIFLLLIGGLMITDLSMVNRAYFHNLSPKQATKELPMNRIDHFLNDNVAKGTYRVFTRDNINDVSWSTHLQILGGYHGAKLKRYRDVLEEAMNINVINMLNAKYIISKENFGTPLSYAYKGKEKEMLYSNPNALQRAWLVDELVLKESKEARIEMLNSTSFNPETTAIVESDIQFNSPLGKGFVNQEPQEDFMHKLKFNVEGLDTDGFLVISEIYYPAGWIALVDGKESDIYPVNHILRGIKLPAGSSSVEMIFAPRSFTISKILSLVGIILALGIFVIGLMKKIKRPLAYAPS